VNLNFRGENMSPVTRNIREDDNVTSRPVYSKSFSEKIQSDR